MKQFKGTKIPPEAREASRVGTLRGKEQAGGLWVFGYGSLMWNPGFDYAERTVGVLEGFHRDFCIWAIFARGTPENPGLSLALKPGGETSGILFRIPADDVEEVTRQLWEREVRSGILKPQWATARVGDRIIETLVFVVDTDHEQFADLPPTEAASVILKAEGPAGTCLEYLENTVEKMDEIGFSDPGLRRLLQRVIDLKGDEH
jgi:cation transport protein ChaC